MNKTIKEWLCEALTRAAVAVLEVTLECVKKAPGSAD
jgi:hypothetical protein